MGKSQRIIVAFALFFTGMSPFAHAEPKTPQWVLAAKDFPEAKRLRAMLQQPESKLDFGKFTLTIDNMIDPKLDVAAGMKSVDNMVIRIRSMMSTSPSANEKLTALTIFLYGSGPWNDFRPFRYDFNDPMGTKLSNKLLQNYIASRKGNCVSMPVLFIILGARLGLDISASTAPAHVLVKYTDPASGTTYNLEATSGALPSRDEWYRQKMPMTDKAIANGLYLQKLTKKETAVVMAGVLAEHYSQTRQFEKALAIADILLEYYPRFVEVMPLKGHCYYQLLSSHFLQQYKAPNQIPINELDDYQYLTYNNKFWFDKAETLGWKQPTQAHEEQYRKRMKGYSKKSPD
jgi:regulator of sirC expression with transglutaminase-like and TPR domain